MLTDGGATTRSKLPEELGSVLDAHLAALVDDLNDRHHNKGVMS